MWFELFSALGGLGVAAFAILTEFMAVTQNHYHVEKDAVAKFLDGEKENCWAHGHHGSHSFLFDQAGNPVPPTSHSPETLNTPADAHWLIGPDGLYVREWEGNALAFLKWPVLLPGRRPSGLFGVDYRKAFQAFKAFERDLEHPPPDFISTPHAVIHRTTKLLALDRRYAFMVYWRRLAIGLTSLGWSGAVISSLIFWSQF